MEHTSWYTGHMLKLYNTRTRSIEEFKPLNSPKVGMYTCGPTVYTFAHIGNLRTYIFEDVLRRVLEFNGYTVKHVMNITDVGHLTSDADTGEDKVEQSARVQGRTAYDIAEEYTVAFFRDTELLRIKPPHVVLKATRTIELQIALIKRLERRGFTYRTSDGIYFDTSKFHGYGQLSKQRLTDKKAGTRIEVNPEKHHPTDFALWKFSPPRTQRQMEWDSPWGVGFPGWHIECSAMSMHELGDQFDIHAGGVDHIPVHHENEIAQSEAATGKHPFVNFWLHGEFLILPEKRMGKSEGNIIMLNDVIKNHIEPLAFRYLVLQTHYRSKLAFSWDALEAADRGLKKLWAEIDATGEKPRIGCAEFEARFRDAVNNDLDTPHALAIMHEMLKSDYPWHAKLRSLLVFDEILALGLSRDAKRPHFPSIPHQLKSRLETLMNQREGARKKSKWAEADALRSEINGLLQPYHRVLDDTQEGPYIRPR